MGDNNTLTVSDGFIFTITSINMDSTHFARTITFQQMGVGIGLGITEIVTVLSHSQSVMILVMCSQ